MSVENMCLKLLRDSNKPWNVQLVSDMLATQGPKKSQVDKALAALAEQGKIVGKEFGKTKVYFPSQEGLTEMQPEEKAAKMQEIKELNDQLRAQEDTINTLKKDIATANSSKTLEELQTIFSELQTTADQLDKKLAMARSGATQVSAADVAKVESTFTKLLDEWTRRRRMFNNLWDAVSENLEGKKADIFEDIGIETDEAVGEVLSNYTKIAASAKKARLKK